MPENRRFLAAYVRTRDVLRTTYCVLTLVLPPAVQKTSSFLPSYVRPQYAVPAAWGLPHAVQKTANFRALAQLPRLDPPLL